MTDAVLRWVVHRALGHEGPGPLADADWVAALPALSHNRLSPLAAHFLGAGLATLPDQVQHTLRGDQERAIIATRFLGRQLLEVSETFAGCDFPWLVLKGLPLAARLYPDPACRPCRDLDLLVPLEHRPGAEARLTGLGYQRAPGATTYHHRWIRPGPRDWTDIVELHWQAGPEGRGAPAAEHLFTTRVRRVTPWGEVWTPAPDLERELLIRHWIRHAGWQLILLLDILLHLGDSAPAVHPLGAPLADDQRRLGLSPRIGGPSSLALLPLRRWLANHNFAERRLSRRPVRFSAALAEKVSAREWRSLVAGLLWPAVPSPRWAGLARSGLGRQTWRWYRLLTLGRGR